MKAARTDESADTKREAAYFVNHGRRNSFPWNLYHGDLQKRVSSAVADHGTAPEILVVGCGLEPYVEAGPKAATYFGCDLDPRAISRCKELYPEMSERLFVAPEPYVLFDEQPPPQFDVVIAKEVIEHVLEPERWAQELAKSVRPGGELILTTPNYSPLSTLALLEQTILELVARKDGYSRKHIHPSKFTPKRLSELNVGSDMQLLSVETTWTNWALVGRWTRPTVAPTSAPGSSPAASQQ